MDFTPGPDALPYYEHLFALSSEGAGEVGAQQAVALFTRSGLAKPLLRECWGLANLRGGQTLSRSEFFMALCALGAAQAYGGTQVPSRDWVLARSGTAGLPQPALEGVHAPAAAAAAAPAARPVLEFGTRAMFV